MINMFIKVKLFASPDLGSSTLYDTRVRQSGIVQLLIVFKFNYFMMHC